MRGSTTCTPDPARPRCTRGPRQPPRPLRDHVVRPGHARPHQPQQPDPTHVRSADLLPDNRHHLSRATTGATLHAQQAWGETASDARHPIETSSTGPVTTSAAETTLRPPPAAMPHARATASSRSRPTGNTLSASDPQPRETPSSRPGTTPARGPRRPRHPTATTWVRSRSRGDLVRSHRPAPRQPGSTRVCSGGPRGDVHGAHQRDPRHDAIPIDDLRARHLHSAPHGAAERLAFSCKAPKERSD
jgi:hypothetical protein